MRGETMTEEAKSEIKSEAKPEKAPAKEKNASQASPIISLNEGAVS